MVAQRPTERTIVLKGNDLYSSQDESSSSNDSESTHSQVSSKGNAYPNESRLVMIMRLLSNQPSAPLNDQRENISTLDMMF